MSVTRGKAALVAITAMVAVVGIAGCSQGKEPTRDESGAITEAESNADVFSIKVGDCTNDGDSTEVATVEAVPCSEEHDNEVYAAFDIADGEYPGDDAVAQEAQTRCGEEFTTFVGMPEDESASTYSHYKPTKGSWSGGDHEVLCVAYADDFSTVTGSLKNVGE